MENETYEVSGVIDSIVYRNDNNGYTVLNVDDGSDLICAVGIMPGLDVGDEVKLSGTPKTHPTYGDQLAVTYFERFAPSSSVAILKYLSSRAIKGIGMRMAQRLVEKFGDRTLEVIENSPEELTQIKGISAEKAKDMSEQVKRTFGFRELLIWLAQYDIRPEEAVRVWKKLGTNARKLIENNPYVLCEEGIGISFERADEIAGKQENSVDVTLRVRAALVHILAHNTLNGYTCVPRDKLAKTCASFTKTDEDTVDGVISQMVTDASLFSDVRESNSMEFIFLPVYHRAESYAAARLQMLLRFPPQVIDNIDGRIEEIEREQHIEYAELQKEAIRVALTKGTLILTGGPGTGKTTTLNAIIRILQENGEKVFLAAPTGRAAQRMSDVTGCEAKTIHRLLEVEWSEDERPVFRKNEQNTLSCDALVLDEVSMIDSLLLDSVMRAFPLGCRLIFVGDSDQLPSVGAGNVLGDMIASGMLPTVALNEVFRQSLKSLIITNAHRINKGEMPVIDRTDNDFFFMARTNEKQVVDTVISLCQTRLPKAYGYSLMTDIQVLSPSKIGAAGTIELNRALQNAVNPPDERKTELIINGRTLREGDKVMQTKNNYNIPWEKKDGTMGEGVFNGDIGVLSEIDRKRREVIVTFDDKTAKYTYDDVIALDLAYCTTVHKSQGNEFEAVIIPMWKCPRPLLYRNILYTAVTRAKKMLILVGSPDEMAAMIHNNKRTLRYTMLRDFLMKNEDAF